MIITDLYADGLTYTTTGNRVNRFSVFANLTPDAPAVDTSPYYLGWIKPENIPADVHYCKGEHVGNGVYKFTDDMDNANFPLGYVVTPTYAFSDYFMVDDSITDSGFNQYRYINQLYPMYCAQQLATSDNYLFAFIAFIYDAGDNYLGRSLVQSFQAVNGATPPARYKFKELYYMLTNLDYTYTVDLGTFGTATFTGHDWENGTFYVETSTGGHARFFFAQYLIYPNLYIQGQSSSFSMRVMPFIRFTYDNGTHSRHIGIVGTHTGSANTTRVAYAESSGSTLSMSRRRYGMQGTVDTSNLSSTNKYTWDGNVLAIFGEDSSHPTRIAFYPFFRLSDFRRTVSLYFRIDNSPRTNGYVLGTTWATNVTPDDEFLAELKTGDFADTNFKNSLRPWQYEDFQKDDFTKDDIPEPEPEPGGDDPGSDEPVDTPLVTGDDQELQTDRTLATPNDFITMYNITPPMLTIFGKTLWKSIVDYDPNDPTTIEVFKNFFTFINESVTGSIDIGSLLQFVVGIRQYPFNVAGLGITESAGNAIKIGTGNFPLELGSGANVQRLTSTIGLLDCGTVTIADYSDFKLYNDFRDYLNTSVSAFLPYCGTVELNPIEVIHNTLHCYYAIDFYTGECTAYITCTDGNHKWLSAIKNGTIGVLIPLTATNSGQISARHQSDNARDSGLIASTMGNLFGAVANIATGNIVGAVGNVVGIAQNDAQQRQMDAERQGRSAIMAPSLSGGSGAAAFYQPSCASVLVRRGTYARDKIANYPSTCAYPATTSGTLNSFHGYTECYNVDVDKLNCNEEERAQVKMILESGVYLP